MKKKFFFLVALVAITLQTSAQVMDWYTYWGSNQAGSQIEPVRMLVDNDGNIYTAALFGGSAVKILDETVPSLSGVDKGDAVITKMSAEKTALWTRALVSTGSAAIRDITIDKENNLIAVGTFSGTIKPDDTHTMTMADPSGYTTLSIFVLRFNPDGDILNMWQLPSEEATINNVSVDGNNNIIISGTFGSEMSFNPAAPEAMVGSTQYFNQMFVAKYTTTGEMVWAKFKQDATASYSNVYSKADTDGNIFVSGTFTGTTTFASTEMTTATAVSDMFLTKYSATGDETWAKHIKGSRNDKVAGIEVSPIGDVAVLSSYYSEDISITGVTDTIHTGFRNLAGAPTQYHIGVFTFKKTTGDYRWWYSYGQGSTAGGGGGLAMYIRCTDEGVWYVGGNTSGRYGDTSTFDSFGNSNSGLRTVDGVWHQHNTNGGADAVYLVLNREGKLASIARPGGIQTEALQDIALSPDKKSVYFLLGINVRANIIYTCVDNLFDSFTDLYTAFPRKEKYTLVQVLCPEAPVDGKYSATNVGFSSMIVAKYDFPEINPNALPAYTSGVEYTQPLAIVAPAGVPQFYQMSISDELNFVDNTVSGLINGNEQLYIGVVAIDSTALPGTITYYAQDPNKVSIRGNSRNVRYLKLNAKDDTALELVNVADATFYPTRCVDVLNVKTTASNYEVKIYTQLGQLVGKHRNAKSISVNNLPIGVYFARLQTESGALKTTRFTVE